MGSKGLKLGNKESPPKPKKEGKLPLFDRLKVLFSSGEKSKTPLSLSNRGKSPPKKKKDGDDILDKTIKGLKGSRTGGSPVKKPKTPPSNQPPKKRVDSEVELTKEELDELKAKAEQEEMERYNNHQPRLDTSSLPEKAKAEKRQLQREFEYLRPVSHEKTKRVVEQPLQEIKSERILAQRPVMETVSDINSISIMDRISLVTYFNDKKSGRLDERTALKNHRENTQLMERYYSLTYFIQEAAKRALELRGEYEFFLQVDSKDRDILDDVLADSNLSSYDISIYYENQVLSKLKIEPVMLLIRQKEF